MVDIDGKLESLECGPWDSSNINNGGVSSVGVSCDYCGIDSKWRVECELH